jgi:outer membrane protein TolC
MTPRLLLLALAVLAEPAPGYITPQANQPLQAAPPAQGLTNIPLSPPDLSPQGETPQRGVSSADTRVALKKSPTLIEVDPSLASRPLSLTDAVAVALAVNPQLAQAGHNVEFYRGRLAEAKDAFYPTLGITPGETLINHIWDEAYGIQATIPLDINHLLATATQQAQFQQIGARLDVNRIRNEVIFSVNHSFFAVLRAQALVAVAETDLQDSLDRLQDAKVRYHAEAVAYIDVLRAQTDVANAQKQLITAQSDVNRAIANLAATMGVDVSSKFAVTGVGSVVQPPGVSGPTQAPEQPSLTSPDPTQLIPAPPPSSVRVDQGAESAKNEAHLFEAASTLGPEYTNVLQEALKTRPEVLETDAQIAAAREGVTLATRSLLPTFQFSVGYYDERSVTGTRYNQPQAFVGITIPLFEGGLARDRVHEAQALVQAQVTDRRQVIDSITLDVQNAYFSIVQARAQVTVANQALAQAQAAFELARIRYNTGVSSRPGVSPIIEVSDSQVALTSAEQNQVNALYDYNVAKAQLDRAVGRFAFVLNDRSGFTSVPSEKIVGMRK